MPLSPTPYSTDYEITDAMFGAFRSSGGARFFWKLVGWGTLFYTVALALTLFPIIKAYINLFETAIRLDSEAPSDAETLEAIASFFRIVPLFLIMSLVMVLVQAVLQASFYRAYFKGELGGLFPFKLGRDEAHQFLSLLGFCGLLFAVYIAFFVLLGFFGVISVTGEGATTALGAILIFFGFIGCLVLTIYLLVALSPATALTAYRGRVHVLAARHVSKNRFWALFGSLLVVLLIAIVVQNIASSIAMMPFFSVFMDSALFTAIGDENGRAAGERIQAIIGSTSFKASVIIGLVAVAASYAFTYTMFMGPAAFFTRQWAEAPGGPAHADGKDNPS